MAVDEVDVLRAEATNKDPSQLPGYAPDDSKMFKTAEKFGEDLRFLQDSLNALNIRHRVFTSNIRMREGNFTRMR